MRIALVCNEYPPLPHGGIGTFTRTYAYALAAAGHDVSVVGLADREHERMDGAVRVVGVGRTRTRGIAWWRDRMRLRDRLVAGHFDVVDAPDYGGLLPLGAGDAPVVLRIQGSATLCASWGPGLDGPPAARRVRWCEREMARRAALWTSPSQHALDATVRVLTRPGRAARHAAPVVVVPHPAPTAIDSADGPPDGLPEGRILLFVGSLWGLRGVAHAARAARIVLERTPDAHMVFVGAEARVDGQPAQRVIRRETGDAMAARVHLPGRVPLVEVTRWMRASDVMLYPSAHEAYGFVLLEAMRDRLPIVGSSRGACSEIVRDGETGLLAAPDDAEALATAALRLLDDTALRERIAAAALDDVRGRFSVEHFVAATLRLYSSMEQTEETVS